MIMYIFVYVPAAGRIASATARNRAGPLPMQASSGGDRARACGGRLQRRGTSLPFDTSAIEAGAQGKDRAFPAYRDRRPLPSALGLVGTNPAHQAVGLYALYL